MPVARVECLKAWAGVKLSEAPSRGVGGWRGTFQDLREPSTFQAVMKRRLIVVRAVQTEHFTKDRT